MRRLVPLLVSLSLLAACGRNASPDVDSAGTTTTSATAGGEPDGGPLVQVTDVATGLDTVWDLAFDSKHNLWFTQRGGRLQQVGGPGRDIPGVVEQGEGGLMGLAIDANDRFFLMMSTRDDNRIIRLDTLDATPVVLVDGIRKAGIHNGGRLRFGPDGTLYAGTGDAGDTSLPPDRSSLNGKILAIDPEKGGATVFTSGHRNPQGLCREDAGRFLSTEHGPDRGDEVNVIVKGKDYGWPDTTGNGIENWTPTIAPAGCVVYESDLIPQWKGSLLFTTLKERDVRRLTFAADGSVDSQEVLYDNRFGRLRSIAVGPDGALYLGTSNKDTRGNPAAGDDRIVRLAP